MTKQFKFKVGDRVRDNGGYEGSITDVEEFKGSHWYNVRFYRGSAVRYESDLTKVERQ